MKKPFHNRIAGYTVFEILIVSVILTLIAAFAIGNFTQAARKNKERVVVQNLQAIHSAFLIYNAKVGDTWNPGGWADLDEINSTFGTNIVADGVTYEGSFIGNPPPYNIFRASWTDGGVNIRVQIQEQAYTRVLTPPCCATGFTCLTVPDC